MTYTIEHYGADGHQGPEDDYVVARGVDTLVEARAIVRQRLGVSRLTSARRWSGMGNTIEAYHDAVGPDSLGCGGFAIVIE